MTGPSFESLKSFFETAPAARKATRPLARGARVNLALDGGPAHFTMESGAPEVRDGAARRSRLHAHAAGRRGARASPALASDDVGEFGIEFFKLVLERDPALKVRVRIDAPTSRCSATATSASSPSAGMKVTWWLLKNGVKNPKAAIDRLRGGVGR